MGVLRILKIDEVLKLLEQGKVLEHNVTHIALFHFIRDENNELCEMHYNTFHALKRRGILKQVGSRPTPEEGHLNASDFYKLKG